MSSPANLIVVEKPPEAVRPPTPVAQTIARQIEALRSALIAPYSMEDGQMAELQFRLFSQGVSDLAQHYAAHRAAQADAS